MLRAVLLTCLLLAATPAAAAVEVTLPETVPADWQAQAELFGRLPYIPPDRNGEVVAWERANADKLSPGFLFDLSRRLLDTAPSEALEWYAVAMMRGYYDAQRCVDTSARRAVSGLARQAAAVARYGRNHPQDFAEAGKRALARPGLFSGCVSADWVCAQGLTGMGGRLAGTTPPSTWKAVEDQIRADFTKQFADMDKR
jgi:hypothetical protein